MRVFTVMGPSQAGKTTLVRALAGLEGARFETLTVPGVAEAHRFDFMDERWTALDFVGGVETLGLAGPALAGSDAAVVCVPADPEAAVLCAPFLRLAEEAAIPTFLFVNGIDKAAGRISEIVAGLQVYCSHPIVLRQVPIREGDQIVGAVDLISERAWQYREGQPSKLVELPDDVLPREQTARGELLEGLADFDDTLLEQLIEDQMPPADEVYDIAARTLRHGDLIPALIGSAEHRNGILRMMKSLRHEAPDGDETRARIAPDADAVAVPLLADIVKHLGKITLVRSLGGTIRAGDALGAGTVGSLTGLNAKTPLPGAASGDVALAIKTDHLDLAHLYAGAETRDMPDWTRAHAANHRRRILPAQERDEARLSAAAERLAQIDPSLSVDHDAETGQIVFGTQGMLHLRRIEKKLTDALGIEVTESPVPVALRETLKAPVEWHHRHRKQSGGAGQFADVVIDLRPEARGFGFAFTEVVKGGAVPRNYIPAVEAGVREALAEGPGGAPVIDLSVTLKDGKHHAVDSSDFAFRTAGKNAVREALAKAGTVLLQPILKVQIHVPSVMAGGLVPLVSALKGQVRGFAGHPTAAGWDVFECLLPAAAIDGLFRDLAGATRGTAHFVAAFDHYEETRREAVAAMEAG